MRTALFSFSIFVYALLFTLLGRWNLPKSTDSILAYWDDLSFVLILTLIIHAIFLLPEASRRVALYTVALLSVLRRVFLYVFILFLQLVMIAEWWHYEFFREYIHYASLGYVSDWKEISRGITGFGGRYAAFIVTSILIMSLYGMEKMWAKNVPSRKALISICFFLSVSCVLSVGIYAKIYINATVENWQTNKDMPLAYKHPILELLREKYIEKNNIAGVTSDHLSALHELYGSRISNDSDTRYPFYNKKHGNEKLSATTSKKQNVIFVVVESFRDYEVGEHKGVSLTPNFDRISKGNFSPKYFYANSNQTIKAEIALLCGVHDFIPGSSISAYDAELNMSCLPKIFQENGYNRFWFHGGYANFYNRDTFFPKIGFNQMHDRFVIEESLYTQGKNYFIRHWGVEDTYVYSYALDELKKQKQPFFAEIMTLSSHHPFYDIENRWDMKGFPKEIQGDMSNMYRKYQYVTHYSDRALGQFWDAFRKSDLYDNTIVVIVGDHGIWLFPDGMEAHASDAPLYEAPLYEAQLYEAYMRLPLTVYFPGKHFSKELTTPLSQVDVPALITAYMGLDAGTGFQSGLTHDDALSLINETATDVKKRNPVFATIGDGYFYRQEDKRCFPSIASKGMCNDYLFRCVKKYNVLQENEHCFSWQEDILHAPAAVSRITRDQSAANSVVDYFRNALFVGSVPPVESDRH